MMTSRQIRELYACSDTDSSSDDDKPNIQELPKREVISVITKEESIEPHAIMEPSLTALPTDRCGADGLNTSRASEEGVRMEMAAFIQSHKDDIKAESKTELETPLPVGDDFSPEIRLGGHTHFDNNDNNNEGVNLMGNIREVSSITCDFEHFEHSQSQFQDNKVTTTISPSTTEEELSPFVIPSANGDKKSNYGNDHNAFRGSHLAKHEVNRFTSNRNKNHQVTVRENQGNISIWKDHMNVYLAEQQKREEREIRAQYKDLTFKPTINGDADNGYTAAQHRPFHKRLYTIRKVHENPTNHNVNKAEETFKPKLNKKTLSIVGNNYIPIEERTTNRQMIEKRQHAVEKKLEEEKIKAARERKKRDANEPDRAIIRRDGTVTTRDNLVNRLYRPAKKGPAYVDPHLTFKPKISKFALQMQKPKDVSRFSFDYATKHTPMKKVSVRNRDDIIESYYSYCNDDWNSVAPIRRNRSSSVSKMADSVHSKYEGRDRRNTSPKEYRIQSATDASMSSCSSSCTSSSSILSSSSDEFRYRILSTES
eukprot:Tbor_TRINITY_DN5425_c1_g2::TRINITY_DN5425_c1_g2_i2::g.24313::m.24313